MKTSKQEISSAYKSALILRGIITKIFPWYLDSFQRNLRKHIAIIYWFARTADDLADEGDLTENERIKSIRGIRKFFYRYTERKIQITI